ncbi:MAG: hypothetical protein CME05_12965, partial [Gemmatimonadaceae bacterium]|nr:hypothetical protein [Gemmatimonadaceae bacterium]
TGDLGLPRCSDVSRENSRDQSLFAPTLPPGADSGRWKFSCYNGVDQSLHLRQRMGRLRRGDDPQVDRLCEVVEIDDRVLSPILMNQDVDEQIGEDLGAKIWTPLMITDVDIPTPLGPHLWMVSILDDQQVLIGQVVVEDFVGSWPVDAGAILLDQQLVVDLPP